MPAAAAVAVEGAVEALGQDVQGGTAAAAAAVAAGMEVEEGTVLASAAAPLAMMLAVAVAVAVAAVVTGADPEGGALVVDRLQHVLDGLLESRTV